MNADNLRGKRPKLQVVIGNRGFICSEDSTTIPLQTLTVSRQHNTRSHTQAYLDIAFFIKNLRNAGSIPWTITFSVQAGIQDGHEWTKGTQLEPQITGRTSFNDDM